MDSEICIPTDRVPPEILQKLKEIGLLLQSESVPASLPAASAASLAPSSIPYKKEDECDDFKSSDCQRHSVVHVLAPKTERTKKTGSDVVSLFEPQKDSGVVSVLDRISADDDNDDADNDDDVREYSSREDKDVVSLFDQRFTSSGQNCGGRAESGKKESEMAGAVLKNHSSPLKDVMNSCNPYPYPTHSHPLPSHPRALSPSQVAPPASSSPQSGLHHPFPAMPYPDASDHHLLSPNPRSSPFKHQCHADFETEDRRVLNNRSPCKTPKRYEDLTSRSIQSPFHLLTHSPSMSESSGTRTATMSSTSSRSRLSPSQQSCSSDDDLFPRGLAGAGSSVTTPSKDGDPKSPKVLTPPETPENEGKRVVPEVFTFDELTCSKERLRLTWERLSKLHDQLTPTKRSPSTPRHPPSTPTTPSYRRLEVQASPSATRISPVDSRLLQRMEAPSSSSASSPKSRLKSSERPSLSPGAPNISSSASQQIPAEDYSLQRRDSLSPKPKKRLCFDEDGGVSTPQLHQRSRNFDANVPPYSLPSPRPSGSGAAAAAAAAAAVENPYSFPSYAALEGQHFGGHRGSPSKSSLSLAEFQKRMTSLAVLHEGREEGEREGSGEEEEELGGGGGPFFSGTRHVYESIEFQNRLAMQGGRYTPKRKRSEPVDDGNDGVAVCTCAVMERDFLKMAEIAYRRIIRFDTPQADFDRIRNELAQTNDILRESLGLMKHIRDLCDHRKRPRW